ncbi:MAG: hypothetical protein IT370_29140 [Deltaproteobacteria bacterium]|nr:hypothetical protein [Deltaproteobacteria bacterium]
MRVRPAVLAVGGLLALGVLAWQVWPRQQRPPRRVLPPRPVASAPAAPEADAAPPASFELLAAGASHSCAVRGGQLACWGAQLDGAVGGAPGEAVSSARPVAGLPAGTVRALALGAGFSCALLDGAAWCWGSLGADAMVTAPTSLGGAPALTALAAGRAQVCGLDAEGAVWCWRSQRGAPAKVAGLPPARGLAVGGSLACVIARAGGVTCWGDADAPAAVAGLSPDVDALALGARFGCAHTPAGAVDCWGDSLAGSAPDAPTTPRRVIARGAGAISAGDDHACALLDRGGVSCWGDNLHGQLGDGSIEGRTTPGASLDSPGKRLLAAGSQHTCAASHELVCWGSDSWRQLGRGGQPRAQGDVERVRPLPAPVEWP